MIKMLFLMIVSYVLLGCSQTKALEQGDKQYHEVMKLPKLNGFNVTHSPDPVYLKEVSNLPTYKYSWVYKTTVSSAKKLTITEFGVFANNGYGWQLANFFRKTFYIATICRMVFLSRGNYRK